MLTGHSWFRNRASDQRECSHEVFFFFVLLDKSIISSLSYQDSRSSTILFLPLTSRPLTSPGTLTAPHFLLPCTPCCATALLTRGHQAALNEPQGPYQGGLPHAVRHLFLSLFCFQPTLEQREARINSQTDTKQRDRETAI